MPTPFSGIPTPPVASAYTDIAYPGPTIVTGKFEGAAAGGSVIAHPSNDGSVLSWGGLDGSFNTNSITRIGNNGAAVWTVTPANLNAAATNIGSIFLDDVDGFIYCLGWNNAGTTIYPCKINAITGAIINIVANTVLAGFLMANRAYFTRRAAYGAGDITIWTYNANAGAKVVSWSTTTGLITAGPTQLTSNGQNLGSTLPPGSIYVSLDGTFMMDTTNSILSAASVPTTHYATTIIQLKPVGQVARLISLLFNANPQLTINPDAAGIPELVACNGHILAGNNLIKLMVGSVVNAGILGVYVKQDSWDAWIRRVYNAKIGGL